MGMTRHGFLITSTCLYMEERYMYVINVFVNLKALVPLLFKLPAFVKILFLDTCAILYYIILFVCFSILH